MLKAIWEWIKLACALIGGAILMALFMALMLGMA